MSFTSCDKGISEDWLPCNLSYCDKAAFAWCSSERNNNQSSHATHRSYHATAYTAKENEALHLLVRHLPKSTGLKTCFIWKPISVPREGLSTVCFPNAQRSICQLLGTALMIWVILCWFHCKEHWHMDKRTLLVCLMSAQVKQREILQHKSIRPFVLLPHFNTVQYIPLPSGRVP